MYHVLNCFGALFQPTLALGAIPDVDGIESWMNGQTIDVPVPEPLVIEIDPDEPGEPLEMYQLEALIMSTRLANALQEAGVDNLQSFAAVLRAPESGRTFEGYRLVNVVGAVSCADMTRSEFVAPPGRPTISVAFDKLVIDERRTGGALLFRLAESLGTILVHDRVKRHLDASGLRTLHYTPVESAPSA